MPTLLQNIIVELDVPMVTRDGVTLRANVYRPAGEGQWPVLLMRLPYGKDFVLGSALLDQVQAVRRGYVVIVQDTRGCGTSDGVWYPYAYEGQDGVDTIAWAAGLPYSDGQVGMYGASYFGFTQWAAAVQRPPGLKALVPFETWRELFNGHAARGGATELGIGASWHLGMGLNVLMRRYIDDPAALGQALSAFAQEVDRLGTAGYWSLPIRDFAPLRRQAVAPAFFETEGTPMTGVSESLSSADIGVLQEGLQIPTYNIGGWYDIFLGDTIANYQAMRSQGAPAKLLIGPWSHSELGGRVGERNFGYAAQSGFINLQTDLLGLHLRWFDHWLKGLDTGLLAEPPVKIFVMGINAWRDEAEWPLARARNVPYYLREGGRLSPEKPWNEAPDVYVYDPEDPVPTQGGATLMTPEFPAGPYDQRAIESRPDVLVYTSDVLGEDLEVTGPVEVHLWTISSAPDTDFVARLTDVFPDDSSICLTDGIVRARYRNLVQGGEPSLLQPGHPYHYIIDLWATSNVFLAGHRIRLQITSSSFPRWDRNQNTGHPIGADAELAVAWQTILHDVEHASYVMLPVVRG
jgi:uncharacterized protein